MAQEAPKKKPAYTAVLGGVDPTTSLLSILGGLLLGGGAGAGIGAKLSQHGDQGIGASYGALAGMIPGYIGGNYVGNKLGSPSEEEAALLSQIMNPQTPGKQRLALTEELRKVSNGNRVKDLDYNPQSGYYEPLG